MSSASEWMVSPTKYWISVCLLVMRRSLETRYHIGSSPIGRHHSPSTVDRKASAAPVLTRCRASQSATGALQAAQAGNQLLALQAQQLADLTAAVAAQGRAQSLEAAQRAEQAEQTGASPVLLCSAPLRPAVRRLTRAAAPRLPVLSYAELGSQLQVETIGVISLAQTADV